MMAMGNLAGTQPFRRFLLCNEAIARGALESGVAVYAGYPGSPTVELLEAMLDNAGEAGIYAEISTNEKVALETAAGAAMAGLRSLSSMKSVGLNVASDTLFSLSYTGVAGGMVIVVADDPSAHSSQSEQDGRFYGPAAMVPILEPRNPQEALAMTKEAFLLSEEFGVPFIIRTVTRVNHQSGVVQTGEFVKRPAAKVEWPHPPARFVTVAASARKFHAAAVERTARIAEAFEKSGFNAVEGPAGPIGIVAAGEGWNCAVEACRMMGLELPVLRLGTVHPLPVELLSSFLKGLAKVIVVEELAPFLEDSVRAIAKDACPSLEIAGKRSGHFDETLEYTADTVARALSRISGIAVPNGADAAEKAAGAMREGLPSRPPTFCPGCPHRASLSILRAALRGTPSVISSDIGCYSMSCLEPLVWGDSVLAMGASLGVANGLCRSVSGKVIALVGDSTFFHAGLPGALNAAYRNADFKLVILDNGVTAMTGQQLHPGTPAEEQPEGRRRVSPEALLEAMGVEVAIVDPYDRRASMPAVKTALESPGFSALIFRRECALHADRNRRRRGEAIPHSAVSPAQCRNYHTCARDFYCPAISLDDSGKAVIEADLCDGCLACAQLCPNSAIARAED